MKVTLINPPAEYVASRWEKSTLPSLGLGYLAAYLEEKGITCEILDAHVLRMKMRDIYKYLSDSKPNVVGVTFTTENRFSGFDAIRIARAALPDSLIVAGGPHVSAAAEDTLRYLPELDVVVRGEGELIFHKLIECYLGCKSYNDVLGITFRQDGNIVSNPRGPFIDDLDSIPFPARHLMPMDCYKYEVHLNGVGRLRALNIMASRGCPFNCSFCASPQMWGRKYRARSAANVLAEIELLVHQYGAESLWIFDDTFTVQRARTVEICEGIASKFPNLRWTCEIRVDTVDKELLALMQRAGCYCVAFGVESGSQRVIDESIGKHIKLEQVHRVIDWCRELNLAYNPFMILSHPGETEQEALETMRLVRKWCADGAQVSMAVMHIYPGTRIEKIAREKGIIPQDFSWSSKEDLKRVPMLPAAQGYVPIFLDKLSWGFISKLLFEWARMQRYSIIKRIPRALLSIRSFADVWRYLEMLIVLGFTCICRLCKRLDCIRKPAEL